MRKVNEKIFADIMGASAPSGATRIKFVDEGRVVDMSYKKGHDVPEGMYLVKLVSVKCHGPYSYKMQVEVLNDAYTGKDYPNPQIISGYAGRRGKDFTDLGYCFADGEVYTRTSKYVGGLGVIKLTHSGWMELMSRDLFPNLFPPF